MAPTHYTHVLQHTGTESYIRVVSLYRRVGDIQVLDGLCDAQRVPIVEVLGGIFVIFAKWRLGVLRPPDPFLVFLLPLVLTHKEEDGPQPLRYEFVHVKKSLAPHFVCIDVVAALASQPVWITDKIFIMIKITQCYFSYSSRSGVSVERNTICYTYRCSALGFLPYCGFRPYQYLFRTGIEPVTRRTESQ